MIIVDFGKGVSEQSFKGALISPLTKTSLPLTYAIPIHVPPHISCPVADRGLREFNFISVEGVASFQESDKSLAKRGCLKTWDLRKEVMRAVSMSIRAE